MKTDSFRYKQKKTEKRQNHSDTGTGGQSKDELMTDSFRSRKERHTHSDTDKSGEKKDR